MKTIALDQLLNYEEDLDAKNRFVNKFKTKTYFVAGLSCLMFTVFSALALFYHEKSMEGCIACMAVAAGAIVLGVVSFICIANDMKHSVPVSQSDGKPMDVYLLIDASSDKKEEWAYVSHEEKKYFRVLYSERGDSFYDA